MRYLIDLSAWAHSSNPAVAERWEAFVIADELRCHPVFALELLHSAITSADYARVRKDLDDAFDWIWPDEDTARIAMRLQQRLATGAPSGQRVKTADVLTAALAVQHRIGVLHYDSDYDVIRDRGGEPFDNEWLAARGSLAMPGESVISARKAYKKAFGERMVQLRDDTDLDLWPELIEWLDAQLRHRDIAVPPPPDV